MQTNAGILNATAPLLVGHAQHDDLVTARRTGRGKVARIEYPRQDIYLPLLGEPTPPQGALVGEEELIVVNFCGLGGSCKGLEKALGRPPTHAINHDPVQISLHRRNMPYTIHHVQDVWDVVPAEITQGRRIRVAWFSPDCTHFSSARGSKPRAKHHRDLGWVVPGYTGLSEEERPQVLFIENVIEWLTWGPLDENDMPIKAREGETFQALMDAIRAHGYELEHRILRACDYGAPTIRKRLFIVARCDGQPIVWPEPTHGDPASEAVKSGRRLPWRTAAECLDWSLPTPSVFGRRRPLVPNTMRRIAHGLKKFVKATATPFVVPGSVTSRGLDCVMLVKSGHYSNRTGEGSHFRGQPVTRPLSTVTASGNHPQPTVARLRRCGPRGAWNVPAPAQVPAAGLWAPRTLTLAGLVKYNGTATAQPVNASLHTVTAKARFALFTACLTRSMTAGRARAALGADTLTPQEVQGAHLAYALMVRHVPGCLTDQDHAERMVFVTVHGARYVMTDVGQRMLVTRELARAQSFDDDMELETGAYGEPITVGDQIHGLGNCVPPIMAQVLAQANLRPALAEAAD